MPTKMPLAQAQGVAIRCVDKVGGQSSELDDVLKQVGFPDDLSVKALRREIVHGDDGVRREGFTMKTAHLASISPDSSVDDVAVKIRANAQPRKDKDKDKGKTKTKSKSE